MFQNFVDQSRFERTDNYRLEGSRGHVGGWASGFPSPSPLEEVIRALIASRRVWGSLASVEETASEVSLFERLSHLWKLCESARESGQVQPHPVPSRPKLAAPGRRSRELAWRRTHRETLQTFAGQWVVLEGEEIVAHGEDPVRVVTEARAKGIRVPYIFYVENTDKGAVKIGL